MCGDPQRKCDYKVTPYRWLILTVFGLYGLTNAFQWISFSPINDKIAAFYNVRPTSVDWPSMVFMIVYIPLIFPVTWLLDKKGLRLTAFLGAFANVLGAAIKCFSPYSNRFVVLLIGQTIAGVSQVFILGLPPRVAAVWFAEREVPAATGLGVFAIQLGTALGFLVPLVVPSVATNSGNCTVNLTTINKSDLMGNFTSLNGCLSEPIYDDNLAALYYLTAGVTAAVFFLTLVVVREKPVHAPSPAQQSIFEEASHASYGEWMKILFLNWNFNALCVTFGIMIGVFNAISTMLNQLVLFYFEGQAENAGYIGMTMVLSGLAGSVLLGFYLSWIGKFKETTFWTYVASFICIILFMVVLHYSAGNIWPIFLIAFLLGFFVAGYIPVGYELAAEITYPAAEGTTSGLLNCSCQIIGIILTVGMGEVLAVHGPLAAQGLLVVALFIGTVITFFIKSDLKRTAIKRHWVVLPIASTSVTLAD